MVYLSRKDIELLAKKILRKHHSKFAETGFPLVRVSPSVMAEEILHLTVNDNYHLMGNAGCTAYSPMEVTVLDTYGKPMLYPLDGKTILVEKALNSSEDLKDEFSYTVMHEAVHHIYRLLFPQEYSQINAPLGRKLRGSPGDWLEWQTDALTSALMMSEESVRNVMHLCMVGDYIDILDPIFHGAGYRKFCTMAEILGVPKWNLAVRMKALGLLGEEHLRNPEEILDID